MIIYELSHVEIAACMNRLKNAKHAIMIESLLGMLEQNTQAGLTHGPGGAERRKTRENVMKILSSE